VGPRPGWSSRQGSPRTGCRVTSPRSGQYGHANAHGRPRRIPATTDDGQSEPDGAMGLRAIQGFSAGRTGARPAGPVSRYWPPSARARAERHGIAPFVTTWGLTPAGKGAYGPGKMPDRTMPAAQRDTLAPWVLRVGMMTGVRGATRTPGRPDTRRGTSRRTRRSPGTPAPMIPPPTSSLLATGARLATLASRHPGRPARPGPPPVPAARSHHSARRCRAALQGTCLAAARRRPAPPGHPGGRPPAGHYPPRTPAPPGPCRPAAWPRPAPPRHPEGRPPRLAPRVAAPRRGGRFPRRNAPRPG
jgi:hypothetical protein